MGEKRGMKALEMWCRRVTQGYPGVSVDNMTTSWRDGLAFCAIIHHFRPDLIDFSRLDKSDVLGNNELAFRIAERHLGIPALLDAEDMAEYPVPDKLSIMTYLSQFYQAFASNGSSPIKRASETPDSSLISDVQSPTPKETVLGARKERCRACKLPVFIAQRLRVGGSLYHRTCFKCCRCGTQLNPASCCQMDGDNYSCEACPPVEMPAPDPPPAPDDVALPSPQTPPPAPSPPPSDAQPTSPNRSLVGIRKMMFESYVKETDDAKLMQTSIKDSSPPTKPSRRLPTVTPPESLAPDRPDRPEDTHSLELVESYNIVLVDKLDSDTKIGDVAPETVNPIVMLHADNNVLNEDKIKITEAVNTDIVCKDDPLPVQEGTSPDDNEDLAGTPFADDYVEPPSTKTDYPSDLNPFGDDVEEDSEKVSTNPFGSSSEEDLSSSKMKPRGTNPFGSDSEDEEVVKRPVPLPRSGGMYTPEPMPRNSRLRSSNRSLTSLCSTASSRKKRPAPPPPTSPPHVPCPPSPAPSRASISSTLSRKKKRAPPPPPLAHLTSGVTSTPVANNGSALSKIQTFSEFLSANQSSLVITDIDIDTPEEESKVVRRLHPEVEVCDSPAAKNENVPTRDDDEEVRRRLEEVKIEESEAVEDKKEVKRTDLEDKVTETKEEPVVEELNQNETFEEPALFVTAVEETTPSYISVDSPVILPSLHRDKDLSIVPMDMTPVKKHQEDPPAPNPEPIVISGSGRRLIPVPKEAWDSNSSTLSSDSCLDEIISPPSEKKNKDTVNLMTKSLGEISYMDTKTRRKKGKAPMPLAPKRSVKPMPAEQLRQELTDIEIKQQELERQGIALEKKIRHKFNAEDTVSSYVEELILQLFELVNEKNELFRKQAELMYLRRQHNLEEEQADIEYQIRKLMSQPEVNKTDSDKELEDKLINRLVEVVERRDAIIQCLEMDRLREAEEDKSIHAQLSLFSQAMGDEENREKITKKLKKRRDKLSSLSLLELDRDNTDPDLKHHHKKKKKWFPMHNKNKR